MSKPERIAGEAGLRPRPTRKAVEASQAKTAWVVFWMNDAGEESWPDAIGRTKEQAYSRFKKLYPECGGKAWKVRRVTMTIHRPKEPRS